MSEELKEPQEQPQGLQEEEIQRLKERLVRLQADFDNYRKQVARESALLARRVQDQEILDFLPVYDALERAFRAFKRNEDSESFIEGVERIFAQFSEILKRKGCEPFDSVGKRFDPAYHEVLVTVEADVERNVIVEEFERGWLRDGAVLRPAKVKVSLGPKGGEPDGGEGKGNRD
ncbi:MAG: Protein GrpE [Acetothermia bacterium 64_32]|nr:MAG: Protein GrpE [Acetothermia bacterium 64_32]MBC7099374.1 nucleotide exchange factor GrpE [Candidatus Bipolaricaulota bacterium]HAF69826.1 nucleotide exchange factor GrpE [Candidatus Acetothermia bacterium]